MTDSVDVNATLFEAHNVRLEPAGRTGTLNVGSRVLRFEDLSFNYQSVLLHAIATADDGSKYLYCQVATDSDGGGDGVATTTADVLQRLGNGVHQNNDDNDDTGDDDDGDDGAGDEDLGELRFVGLDEAALAACYEALSRAAAMNPDLEVDEDSFFGAANGGANGFGAHFMGGDAAAVALAAWDAKLDLGDDDDAEDVGEPVLNEDGEQQQQQQQQFEDADESDRRTTTHDENGKPKKMRTDE